VIDIQDPWRTDYYERKDSRQPPGGWKYQFARLQAWLLEGWTYRRVSAVMSVSPSYLDDLRARYPAFARVPAEVAKNILALVTEKRVISRQVFAADSFAKTVEVSDADIKKWYDANQDQLRIPENVDVQYLVLNEEAATKDVNVSDADIESFYKQNQARYGQPERRRVSHILIEVPASADEPTKTKARARAEDVAKRAAASGPVRLMARTCPT
jgi:peptidyl-prolyl cis-trans isomerase D